MSTSPLVGTLETLLIAPGEAEFRTSPVSAAEFDLAGNRIVGSVRNGGQVIGADVRSPSFQRRTPVLNRQSVSLISSADLDHIAAGLELDERACLDGLRAMDAADGASRSEEPGDGESARLFLARCLGINVVIGKFEGDFLALPPGIDLGPYDVDRRRFTGAAVMITRVNSPCAQPGAMVERYYPRPIARAGKRFVQVAKGRRGYVGMVVKGGTMAVGQVMGFVPFGGR